MQFIEFIKTSSISYATRSILISLAAILLFASLKWPKSSIATRRPRFSSPS